jgi:hypothetical protein
MGGTQVEKLGPGELESWGRELARTIMIECCSLGGITGRRCTEVCGFKSLFRQAALQACKHHALNDKYLNR